MATAMTHGGVASARQVHYVGQTAIKAADATANDLSAQQRAIRAATKDARRQDCSLDEHRWCLHRGARFYPRPFGNDAIGGSFQAPRAVPRSCHARPRAASQEK